MRIDLPYRKCIRLPAEAYNEQGLYFITICTQNRDEILGKIGVGDSVLDGPHVILSQYGEVVEKRIMQMQDFYENLRIEYYVIMPNHVHLIINILKEESNGSSGTPTPTNTVISKFISTFKRFCNREIGENIWQRSYHDHIIRDGNDLQNYIDYIYDNPKNWLGDE